MVKISLTVANLDMEIEAEAEECAALLQILARNGGPDRNSKPRASPPEATTAKPSGSSGSRLGGRTYGGRTNRRQLVLDTFRILAREGNDSPSLDEIKRCFSTNFPDEQLRHLDQVVRDLANKTGLLARCEWGRFQLTGQGSGGEARTPGST